MHVIVTNHSILLKGTIGSIIQYLERIPGETRLTDYIKLHLH